MSPALADMEGTAGITVAAGDTMRCLTLQMGVVIPGQPVTGLCQIVILVDKAPHPDRQGRADSGCSTHIRRFDSAGVKLPRME